MKLVKPTLLLAAAFFANSSIADVAIIVNPSNGISSLSEQDAKRIFLGKSKKFASGTKAAPVDAKEGNPPRDVFYSSVLGKNAAQVKAYWSTMIFSGKGTPPKEIGNDADIVSHVAKNADAIGYIDASAVNGSVKTVLTIK